MIFSTAEAVPLPVYGECVWGCMVSVCVPWVYGECECVYGECVWGCMVSVSVNVCVAWMVSVFSTPIV